MAEQENDRDKSDGTPDSALPHELTKRAEMKLADLEARKADILRKMQRLRYLADNLAGRRRTTSRNETTPERSTSRVQGERRFQPTNEKLRRACRIALMECEDSQSSSQIYERIKRRGSAGFEEYRHPLQSLLNELETMVREGEVLCSHADHEKLWHLKRE